jgi:hypothetical protein
MLLSFIHVAKTGGQSVETLLESAYGIRHTAAVEWEPRPVVDPWDVDFVVPKYDPDDFRRLKRLCPIMKSVGGHSVALWSNVHEVQPTQYFSIVREPIKRGASHFQYQVRTEAEALDWARWCEWPVHQNHQVKMFSRRADTQDAIAAIQRHGVFVGLTERFDESLVVFKRLFRPDLNICYTRTNTARDNAIADGLLADPAKRAELERMYRDEIPLYEWIANEYYPRFVKEYGPTLARDVEEFRRHRDRVNRLNIKLNRAYFRLFIRSRVPRQPV